MQIIPRNGPEAPADTPCDREPIHVPGSIQPHGVLLVADADDGRVIATAGPVDRMFGTSPTGARLSDLLRLSDDRMDPEKRATAHAGRVDLAGFPHDVLVHRSEGRILVEIEPAMEQATDAVAMMERLDAVGTVFERAVDLRDLCVRAAGAFRDITGYDRVMVYRFLDDEAGVVVAEDRDPSLSSFMNHHFPASDIPKQARALYVRNRVRVIPDVGYAPAPILSDDPSLVGIDLSDVGLRSVSPIHVQYLRNMGVAASASVSIVKDGILWGLVACHASAPRTIPHETRMACRILAGALARQIRGREEADLYKERIRLRSAEDAVAAKLAQSRDMDDPRLPVEDAVRMLSADGFALLEGRELVLHGACPSREDVREIADFVLSRAGAAVVSTDALSSLLPGAQDYADTASGLLAFVVSAAEPCVLMWFRAERLRVVEWAGNPHKAVAFAPGETLTPRSSFEAWSETVGGRSEPWTLPETEAAERLLKIVVDARSDLRMRGLVRELTTTVDENKRLLAQKDYLMGETNHRIQNSLQLVSAFLAMQARSAGDPVVADHLQEARRRLAAVSLVHKRLYGDGQVSTVDLGRYLRELCDETVDSMDEGWKDGLVLDLAPISIRSERAVQVGLLLTELAINAVKYAYGGRPGPLSIALEQHRNRFRLVVADSGAGRTGSRTGFGTRMMNAVLSQLGGTLDESDNGPGLRIVVSAPIEA